MSTGEQGSDAFCASEYVEDLIKDYLYFRGYSTTLKAMESDQKNSRDKLLQPTKIIREIQCLIDTHDLSGLRDYWSYLDKQFFSRLERDHLEVMRKIETGVLRLYLTSAIREGKKERVNEFFEMLATDLHQLPEWKDWFAVPYIKGIQEHPKFGRYFGKLYLEKVMVSLHNFISTILAYMPKPILLRFEEEMSKSKRITRENDLLVHQISQANVERRSAEEQIQKLKSQCDDKDKQLEQLKTQLKFLVVTKSPNSQSVGNVKETTANPLTRLKVESNNRSLSMGENPRDCPILHSLPPKFSPNKYSQAVTASSYVVPNVADENGEVLSPISPELVPDQLASPYISDPISVRESVENPVFTPPLVPDSSISRKYTINVDKNLITFYNCEQLDEAPFLFLSREQYTGHGSPLTHCKVAPGGLSVASADSKGGVRVWEFGERINEVYRVNCSSYQVLSLEWESKYAKSLFVGGNNSKVQLYSITNRKLQHELELNEYYPRVLSIACHPINNSFVLACSESAIRPSEYVFPPKRNSIKSPISIMDQHRLGILTIWDWKTLKMTSRIEVQPRPFSITTTSFNHNGNLLLTGGVDGMVRLYDLSNQGCIMGWHAHSGEVNNLLFSNDENSIYSMGNDSKFTQWSIHNMGQRLQDIPVEVDACIPHLVMGKGQPPFDSAVGKLFAFDSDSDHVLTCGNPRAHVYNILRSAPVEHILSIGGHDGVVTCVDWCGSQNCCSCITGSADGNINVTTLLRQ